jgi:uncharacterized protein (DUF2237 family)
MDTRNLAASFRERGSKRPRQGRPVAHDATVAATGALPSSVSGDTDAVSERNVLGGPLEPCGRDPVTGFFRDGCCRPDPHGVGTHLVCAVVTAEFLEHQQRIGNDLSTPRPQYGFPGLAPGDRWCVTVANWLRAYADGVASFVVLASTSARALDTVPLAALKEQAVDVPADPRELAD